MKKILFLMMAVLSCLLCPARKVEVKVMSYNIRHTGEAKDTGVKHWDARKFATINMIRTETPDVIGMQEVRADQKEFLIAELPEYQGVMESKTNTKFIMFRKDRFELLDQGNFWLSETPDVPSKGWGSTSERATLWVKLKELKTGKIFFVFNTHLDVTSKEARIKGSAMCCERMEQICGKDAVQFIIGDMNSSEEEVLGNFEGYLKDARKTSRKSNFEPTYNGFGKTKVSIVIDHIYYLNAKPVRFQLMDGKDYGVEFISDHYPIQFTARF